MSLHPGLPDDLRDLTYLGGPLYPGDRVDQVPAVHPARSLGAAAGAVVLRLGASRYAVDMADVAEVAMLPTLTRLPGSAPWLVGLANWRGRMLPVLDIRPLLGTPQVPHSSSVRLVVIARDEVVVGLVAEAVPGVYDEGLDAVAPAPPTLSPEASRLVAGQVTDEQGPMALLDVAAVLALRERVDRRRHGA